MKEVTKQGVVDIRLKEYMVAEIIQLTTLILHVLRSVIDIGMHCAVKCVMPYKSRNVGVGNQSVFFCHHTVSCIDKRMDKCVILALMNYASDILLIEDRRRSIVEEYVRTLQTDMIALRICNKELFILVRCK